MGMSFSCIFHEANKTFHLKFGRKSAFVFWFLTPLRVTELTYIIPGSEFHHLSGDWATRNRSGQTDVDGGRTKDEPGSLREHKIQTAHERPMYRTTFLCTCFINILFHSSLVDMTTVKWRIIKQYSFIVNVCLARWSRYVRCDTHGNSSLFRSGGHYGRCIFLFFFNEPRSCCFTSDQLLDSLEFVPEQWNAYCFVSHCSLLWWLYV